MRKMIRFGLIAVAASATLAVAACKPKTPDEVPADTATAPAEMPANSAAAMDSAAAVDAAIAASPTATEVPMAGSSGSAAAVQ